jgi:hypothetical protein
MKGHILILILIINSCSYPELSKDELVYQNNFEDYRLDEIDGGTISYYNNTNVIGNYNNDGFTLHLTIIFTFHLTYIFMDHGMEILMVLI